MRKTWERNEGNERIRKILERNKENVMKEKKILERMRKIWKGTKI
jgi:hypothetical protein